MNAPIQRAATKRTLHEVVRDAILEVGFFDNVLSLSAQGRRVGPCDLEAERFLIASVLWGDAKPAEIRLNTDDFWAVFHRRIWRVLLDSPDPTNLRAVENLALDSGALLGPIAEQLEQIKQVGGDELARSTRDIGFAAERVAALAQDCRLARLLISVHADLCTQRVDVKGARLTLSNFFKGGK